MQLARTDLFIQVFGILKYEVACVSMVGLTVV